MEQTVELKYTTKDEENEKQSERIRLLVENNILLAKSIAIRFCKFGESVEDSEVYSSALLGLFRAAKTYNAAEGAFSTWATCIIRNEIFGEYRDKKKTIQTTSLNSHLSNTMSVLDPGPDWPRAKLYEWLQIESSDSSKVIRNKRITLLVLHGDSYSKIGKIFGLTREGVRQGLISCINHIKSTHRQEIENTVFKWPGEKNDA